jgi:HSP20 family molecular chaperone IbpA
LVLYEYPLSLRINSVYVDEYSFPFNIADKLTKEEMFYKEHDSRGFNLDMKLYERIQKAHRNGLLIVEISKNLKKTKNIE